MGDDDDENSSNCSHTTISQSSHTEEDKQHHTRQSLTYEDHQRFLQTQNQWHQGIGEYSQIDIDKYDYGDRDDSGPTPLHQGGIDTNTTAFGGLRETKAASGESMACTSQPQQQQKQQPTPQDHQSAPPSTRHRQGRRRNTISEDGVDGPTNSVPLEKIGKQYQSLRRRGAGVRTQLLKSAFDASFDCYDSEEEEEDYSIYASSSTLASRDGIEDPTILPRKRIRGASHSFNHGTSATASSSSLLANDGSNAANDLRNRSKSFRSTLQRKKVNNGDYNNNNNNNTANRISRYPVISRHSTPAKISTSVTFSNPFTSSNDVPAKDASVSQPPRNIHNMMQDMDLDSMEEANAIAAAAAIFSSAPTPQNRNHASASTGDEYDTEEIFVAARTASSLGDKRWQSGASSESAESCGFLVPTRPPSNRSLIAGSSHHDSIAENMVVGDTNHGAADHASDLDQSFQTLESYE